MAMVFLREIRCRRFLSASILLAMVVIAVSGRNGAFAADAALRHQYVRAVGLPAPYAGLRNPLRPDEVALAAGAAIYETRCAGCHGVSGKGDGENGFYYSPKPTDLTSLALQGENAPSGITSSDQYIFWSISEGGGDLFETSMAPFKDELSPTERWQLVLYIRSGF